MRVPPPEDLDRVPVLRVVFLLGVRAVLFCFGVRDGLFRPVLRVVVFRDAAPDVVFRFVALREEVLRPPAVRDVALCPPAVALRAPVARDAVLRPEVCWEVVLRPPPLRDVLLRVAALRDAVFFFVAAGFRADFALRLVAEDREADLPFDVFLAVDAARVLDAAFRVRAEPALFAVARDEVARRSDPERVVPWREDDDVCLARVFDSAAVALPADAP